MGTPEWTSPLHYDTGSAADPGIHADFNFSPGVGQVIHTLSSIAVTRDANSPYDRVEVTRAAGMTNWISPVVPAGSSTIPKGQINAAGFSVMEDINGITALGIGNAT